MCPPAKVLVLRLRHRSNIFFHENLSPPLYFKSYINIMASSTLSRPLHIFMASITHSYSNLYLYSHGLCWLSHVLYWLSHGPYWLFMASKYTVTVYIDVLSEIWCNSHFITSKLKALKWRKRFKFKGLKATQLHRFKIKGLKVTQSLYHHKKKGMKRHIHFIASKKRASLLQKDGL